MNSEHTKKYMRVGGHLIEMSFADTANKGLFSRISEILLNPHICKKEQTPIKSKKRRCYINDG